MWTAVQPQPYRMITDIVVNIDDIIRNLYHWTYLADIPLEIVKFISIDLYIHYVIVDRLVDLQDTD